MKKLVLTRLRQQVKISFDPLQFAYSPNLRKLHGIEAVHVTLKQEEIKMLRHDAPLSAASLRMQYHGQSSPFWQLQA